MSSLKELNLKNFNANNITDISDMFYVWLLLKELKLNNFNANNVNVISDMFYGWSSLKG